MSSSVGVWEKVHVPWIATALNLWIRTDKRWNRKALSRWSLDTWEMRLSRSLKNYYCSFYRWYQ